MQGVIAAVPTLAEADGAPVESLFVDHCGSALDGLRRTEYLWFDRHIAAEDFARQMEVV